MDIPVSSIYPAETPIPSGWLACDGSVIDSTEYPALFPLLGNSFGTVAGTLPDIPDYMMKALPDTQEQP